MASSSNIKSLVKLYEDRICGGQRCIPIRRFANFIIGGMETCAICIDDIQHDNNYIQVCECKHRFHKDCLYRWLLGKRKEEMTCPTCRSQCFQNMFIEGTNSKHGVKITYKDGYSHTIYEGEWKDDKRNGRGKLTWANGDVYEGDFKNDKRNGRGKETYDNGDFYEGEFKNGKVHGRGKETYANGDVYEGEWKDDKLHGRGKKTFANGDIYEGDFKDDVYHGRGKFTKPDGEGYEGEWTDGKKNGKGKITYANGDVYEGQWYNGRKKKRKLS